jgi:hypothetical protein
MMCKPCKGAADYLSDASKYGKGDEPSVRRQARYLHSECDNPPTCTCQHRIPKSQKEIDDDKSNRYALVS